MSASHPRDFLVDDAQAQISRKKTMLMGGSRLTAGPVRFHFDVFLKQLLYHILPWPLGGILVRWFDGEQAAVNQLLTLNPWRHFRCAKGEHSYGSLWVVQRFQDVFVLGSFMCYFARVGLSSMDAFLVLIMWGSRMLLIAVKYAYLDKHEMQLFHSETSVKRAMEILSDHLLSGWIAPSWLDVLREVSIASQRAGVKGSQAWYTRNKGLRLLVTFIGPDRCARALDILDLNCWGHPRIVADARASAEKAVLERDQNLTYGKATGDGPTAASSPKAVRVSVPDKLWQCPRARLKYGRVKGIPHGYSTRDSDFEARHLFKLEVPAGLLLSAVIYKNSIEGRESGLIAAVRRVTTLLSVCILLTPLLVRLTVPELPPESVLVGLNVTAGVDETLRELVSNTTTMVATAAAAAPAANCGVLGRSLEGAGQGCLGLQILAYVFFVGGYGFNGLTMFLFLYVSVLDYWRRAGVLETLREMLRPTIGGVGRDLLERARAEEELLIDGQSVATSDSFSDRRSPSFDDASRAGFVMPQTGVCDAAERPKKNRDEAEKKETPLSDIRSSDEVDAAVLQDRAPDLFRRSVRKADSSPASPPPPNDRHLPASGHASGQAGTDKTLPTSATARKYSRRYSIFTEVQLHYEKQPPLVDSRMFDNTYCVVMMKEAVLYFGKDYLMRTQFMLSYVIVNIVILLAIALISLFASSTMPAAAVLAAKKFFPLAYSWRHFSEANCVAILMTVGVSVVIIVALTFADFANSEPLYFRQALASQALGIQSDLQSMVSQDITNEKDIARSTSGRDRKEDSAKEVEDDELVRKMVHRDHVRRKLMLRSKTIDHVQHLIAAMDLLYPIKILGMRADWGHMSGIVAILASAAAGIWRATSQ